MIARIIKIIISVFYLVLTCAITLARRGRGGSLVVLTYHSIKPQETRAFARHMDAVKKAGRVVFADSIPQSCEHCLAVTFDDGFQSFVGTALPLMIEKEIPATVFVTSGCLGARADWITDRAHKNYGERVMTKRQIAELKRQGVLIGSHSVTHCRLENIAKTMINHELLSSKHMLEEALNAEVNLFSFPYGSCNDEIISMCKTVGYKKTFLNIPLVGKKTHDDFVVGRIDVSLDDWPIEYKLKFRGAYTWLGFIVKMKRRFIRCLARTLGKKWL